MSTTEIQSNPTLVGLSLEELIALCQEWNEPAFRARQLFHWIYNRQVKDFILMDNLPKTLREKLARQYTLRSLDLVRITQSEQDATQKYLFSTSEGHYLESVLIQDGDRITLCVSSQIGCALDCTFCATATMGFRKNLSVSEIVEQFLQVQDRNLKRITNVVFMGMGEPFLNYTRVIQAAALLNATDGINISARKITLSTAGVVPKIRRFTAEGQRFKLAISLNATTDDQRNSLMPINQTYPLDDLMNAAREYAARSRNRITFEYVLLNQINDTPQDARRLKSLLAGLRCKVNVIPYNEIGGNYTRPSPERITAFLEELKASPFTVTVRWSGGDKIRAGCGQLAVEEVS